MTASPIRASQGKPTTGGGRERNRERLGGIGRELGRLRGTRRRKGDGMGRERERARDGKRNADREKEGEGEGWGGRKICPFSLSVLCYFLKLVGV